MGGVVDTVGDLWDDATDWVAQDLLGMPDPDEAAEQAAQQQAEMEAAMAAETAANQAYMEEEARRKLATKRAGEKRTQSGIRIGGIAAQRGGTGKLLRGSERRIGSTREGYNKWGAKGKGLNLSLRGGSYGGRRPT